MIKVNGKVLNNTRFPNGESKIDVAPIELNSEEVCIEYFHTDDSELLQLYFVLSYIKDKLKDIDPEQKLILSYLPYSRMDRYQSMNCFTLKHIVHLLSDALGLRPTVYIMEPHSDVSIDLFENHGVSVVPVYLTKDLLELIVKEYSQNVSVVCFPDKGARKRYSTILDTDLDVVHCEKIRDFQTGAIVSMELCKDSIDLNGREVLIVDDLCSKGGTFMGAAKLLKDAGASKVYLAVCHIEDTILDGDAWKEDSPIDKIFATNSMNPVRIELSNASKIGIIQIDTLKGYREICG